MPKRSRTAQPKGGSKITPASRTRMTKPRQPKRDPNQAAFAALQHVIEQTEGTGKNPLAVALGRLGGLKGGKARAEKLTQDQRRESALRAAKARWSSKDD